MRLMNYANEHRREKMNKTIKLVLLLVALFILIISCEKKTNPDTTPPNVTITNPQDGSTVFELTSINCVATDNDKIDKVELWVNGISTEIIDETEPYSLLWDTTIYEDESMHTITIRAYDESENIADSEPITVYINNTLAYPTPVELYPIYYHQSSFTITCSQNYDDNFSSYEFYESLNEDMSYGNLIFETSNRIDTTYIVTGISLNEIRYYQVIVKDYSEFESFSNIEFGIGRLNLYINEFMALNQTCFADEYGEYNDWIEIYNGESEAIDIGGMYVTDDLMVLAASQIPTSDPSMTTIEAGGFLILWADRQPEHGILHLDIKLSSSGEQIGLTDVDGTTILDSLTFGVQTADISYGRLPDGSETWEFFTIPTPGASNY